MRLYTTIRLQSQPALSSWRPATTRSMQNQLHAGDSIRLLHAREPTHLLQQGGCLPQQKACRLLSLVLLLR